MCIRDRYTVLQAIYKWELQYSHWLYTDGVGFWKAIKYILGGPYKTDTYFDSACADADQKSVSGWTDSAISSYNMRSEEFNATDKFQTFRVGELVLLKTLNVGKTEDNTATKFFQWTLYPSKASK